MVNGLKIQLISDQSLRKKIEKSGIEAFVIEHQLKDFVIVTSALLLGTIGKTVVSDPQLIDILDRDVTSALLLETIEKTIDFGPFKIYKFAF